MVPFYMEERMRKFKKISYEQFKKDILSIAKIDLNSYKEKQMRRRINTLITKNNIDLIKNLDYEILKEMQIKSDV